MTRPRTEQVQREPKSMREGPADLAAIEHRATRKAKADAALELIYDAELRRQHAVTERDNAASDMIDHATDDIPVLLAEIRRLRTEAPAPPPVAPAVVVSEEAWRSVGIGSTSKPPHGETFIHQQLRAAFPILLRDNPKLVLAEAKRINPMIHFVDTATADGWKSYVDAEIRRRVEALDWRHLNGIGYNSTDVEYDTVKARLIAALLTRPRDAAEGGT